MYQERFVPDLFPSRTAYKFQPLKPQLREQSLENFFEFVWKHDPYKYEHPRDRLQIVLAILLFFHLGLHPIVALSEGFYYGDTTLLTTNRGGDLRVVLLIRLNRRKKN